MKLQPYVFFNGDAEAAAHFYRDALGAGITMLMPYRDCPETPDPAHVPPGNADKVMHMSLSIGDTVLMGADDCSGSGRGFAGFSLSLSVAEVAEAEKAFAALADGGSVCVPLGPTFFSPAFGMLNDRFGVSWMIVVM